MDKQVFKTFFSDIRGMYPHSRTFQAFKKNKQGEKRILISGNHLYIPVQITQFLVVTVIEPCIY